MSLCESCGKKLKARSLQEMCLEYKGKVSDEMLHQFWLYWSEPNARGKERWQLQQTFDVGRRLATWQRNQERRFK